MKNENQLYADDSQRRDAWWHGGDYELSQERLKFYQTTNVVVTRSVRLVSYMVSAIIIATVAVLFSAFVYPGWATDSEQPTISSEQLKSGQFSMPSAKRTEVHLKALPANASQFLQSMPSQVAKLERIDVQNSSDWSSYNPIEEYALVYGDGSARHNVMLHIAQWQTVQLAEKAYSTMVSRFGGVIVNRGDIRVNNVLAGHYVQYQVDSKTKQVTAVWHNGTVVVKIVGNASTIATVLQHFPF